MRAISRKIAIDEKCNGCAWWVDHCPVGHIRLDEQRQTPVFSNDCVMCFRCVYGCPRKAMHANDFQVLKGGFDLWGVEKRMADKALKPLAQCCEGIIWAGVRSFLDDSDGY